MMDNHDHTTGFNNKQLLDRIASAQIRIYDKLMHLDINALNISEYSRQYLSSKIDNAKGVLQLYGQLLFLSLRDSSVVPESFVLVDYGGGSGLISLLAIEMGIGTVIYNDIFDISCRDVNELSNIFGFELDHVVCGDVDQLISYLNKNTISINAITSYDVLEHIYDVESHFKKLSSLSDKQFRIVYASGANIANPLCSYIIKKRQVEVEYKDREKTLGHKEIDCLQSYLKVRENMIAEYAPDLNYDQIEQLARSTRGLIRQDITKCVDEYRRQGNVTYQPDHPTNTCDPYTGNWCEHLIDPKWLEQILKDEGFSAQIMIGHYHTYKSLLKKTARPFLNVMIRLLGKWGIFFAPYYIIYADFLPESRR